MNRKIAIRAASLLAAAAVSGVSAMPCVCAAPAGGADYHSVYSMVSDPPTSRFTDYFPLSTIENGRIWTDKTVTAGSLTFHDYLGNPLDTIDAGPDQFLVTLSALSQSYSIETVVEPTDTVFVLDVSASMYISQLGGVARAAVMISALNTAIRTIMDADPANRVAVVAYGGYASGGTNMARGQTILALGHYDVTGNYLNISSNSRTITVNPGIPSSMVVNSSVAVDGGTPTQRGIFEGAQVLANNTDTAYTYTTEKGRSVTITRRPVMVLLTDGEPTFGWDDYTMKSAAADNSYNHGDGNPAGIDMGTDLLTVLTASYWKRQVSEHYYGGSRNMRFFTIGVGVSGVNAPAVMDPAKNAAANSQTFSGTVYNMKALLDQFVDPAEGSITFPALNKGSTTVRSLTTVANAGHYVTSYHYTDGYYPADNRQALDDAFQSIAYDIITMGSYTTESDPSHPDFSGYVAIADPIGPYMQFKESKGARVNGQTYYGRRLAQSITAEHEGSALWDYWAGVLANRMGIGKATAAELIATNIAGGAMYYRDDSDFRSMLRWYANDTDHFVGLYYDRGGDVLPPPAGATCIVELHPMYNEVYNDVSGTDTNLLYMYLEVTTALAADTFSLRGRAGEGVALDAGQQMVGWYVPASLIPMRTVSERYDEDDPSQVTGMEIKEAYPIRTSFTVGLRDGFDTAALSAAYKAGNRTSDGKGYYFYTDDWPGAASAGGAAAGETMALYEPNRYNPYYYYTEDTPLYVKNGTGYALATSYGPGTDYYTLNKYFDENTPGYIAEGYAPVNQRITRILTALDGSPYIPAGERREVRDAEILKASNPTGTAAPLLAASFDGAVQIDRLGNNGRLTLPLSALAVDKAWRGTPLASAWVQLYADGQPYLDPVELTGDGQWRHIWDDLPRYETAADAEGQVALKRYTVAEGSYEDGVFTPFSEEHPLDGYGVSYTQPVWNSGAADWGGAVITNTQNGYTPPAGVQNPPTGDEPLPRGPLVWAFGGILCSGAALLMLIRYRKSGRAGRRAGHEPR